MQKIINFLQKRKQSIFYTLLVCMLAVFLYIIIPKEPLLAMLDFIENKTFDLRQKIISQYRTPRKDIVIVTIDDPSYEYMIETYGDWPVPRYIYADILNYIQAQKPKYTIFDLLFVKSLRSVPGSDEKLAEAFRRHPGTFTAINFDNTSSDVRKPPFLDEKMKTNIVNESKTMDAYEFTNCRPILSSITDITGNIGHINTFKSDDGLIRQIPVFITYPDYKEDGSFDVQRNYLYMTVKLAADYLKTYENEDVSTLRIDENNNFIMGSRVIPMTIHAEAVLNWYGESGLRNEKSFKYIPMWKILKSIEAENNGGKPLLAEDTFKDKIVYIGTSVFALSDIKTVPSSKYMPGVEVHAVLLSNILDNDIIKKASVPLNMSIALFLAAIAALLAFKVRAVHFSIASLMSVLILYIYFSGFIMLKFNLWIWIAAPVSAAAASFALAFLIKYLITSRDFEHMYKLAATDGLTELYNHRFFQEQIRKLIAYADRTKTNFSLIMIDIDFFKKFNDNYGHQAGDAVLKHVAKTLKTCVRQQDFVCRYGGEEMTILLNSANRETAVKIAQNICSTIASKKFSLSPELEVHITVSLGVSSYPQNGRDAAELIEYADKCLYKAKENGRNQVGFTE